MKDHLGRTMMDKQDLQGWLDRLSKIRGDTVDFFRQLLGKKETDAGILQLAKAARTNPTDPQPQVDLAMGYVARIQTPPNWDESDVKNALRAFRKASSISKEHDPSRTQLIQEQFVEAMYGVGVAYKDHYNTDPNIKRLNRVVWLLESILPEAKENPEQTARIRTALRSCLLSELDWHRDRVESAPERDDLLREYLSIANRAMSYCDEDDPVRSVIGHGSAVAQLLVGLQFADLASQSHVLGGQDGTLLCIDDKEHKAYARKAIDLLRSGREQLKQYPPDEEFDAQMAIADQSLGVAYSVLYNLTYAHSKMSESIPILQEGVEVLPNDADLWHALGTAYDALADEVIEDTNARIHGGQKFARVTGESGFGAAVGSHIAVSQGKKTVDRYAEQARQCFLLARSLAPDKY
jgi:tetratricopeptide (TPR) repeat protein